ncbi:MAG: alpha-1,2-fucosyltransferase [Nitrospirota bacterium]
MVIVRLMGGLGNQLFQYAVARHLAEIHKTVLKIDISGFKRYKSRKYYLSAFKLRENFTTDEEVRPLVFKKCGIIGKLIARSQFEFLRPSIKYIKERHFHFDPEILKSDDNVYLDGYWQSERYFSDINDIIRREFEIKSPQEGRNKELAEQIASVESVSLHIRRGDYIDNSKTQRVHGCCGMDYYNKCVEYICERVSNPHFFVFADDPEWSRKNLNFPFPLTLVDHNGDDKCYEDLRLMSQCKFHIIANSTFSWWGVWLNVNPSKIVLAPKKWFRSNKYDTKDLYPTSWIKI